MNLASCFALFLGLAVVTEGQAEDYYIYQAPNGELVISNKEPPPGSKIIKQLPGEVPQGQEPRKPDRRLTEAFQGQIAVKELTIRAASHLLIGLLGATGLVLSLVFIWKASQFSHRLRGFMKSIVWSALAIVCLCAIVLFANSPETVRAFEIISHRVQASDTRVLRTFS